MPRFLNPRKSIQHRVAAIALYRALLSRCSTSSLLDERRNALTNVIRQKFRKNVKLQGSYPLSIAFRAGYEALDHLDAASTGDSSSLNFLGSYIATIPNGLKRPPPIYPPAPPKLSNGPKHPLECLPPETSLLRTRPRARADLAGPRRVPILSSTQGIPFLRVTKPQPPSLSRIIRARLKQNHNGFENRVLLENYYAPLAKQEDEWDEMLLRDYGVVGEGGQQDHVKWMDALEFAMALNRSLWDKASLKRKEVAKEMMIIVDRETKLAKQEGTEIVRGRVKNWKQNKRVAT